MSAELAALATAGATTVVTLLATDAWSAARAGVVGLWRRWRPERADAIEADLVETRAELTAADPGDEERVKDALVAEWQGRLRRLVNADPAAATELKRLLDEELTPALPPETSQVAGRISMRARASGHGRSYQAGRDLTIRET